MEVAVREFFHSSEFFHNAACYQFDGNSCHMLPCSLQCMTGVCDQLAIIPLLACDILAVEVAVFVQLISSRYLVKIHSLEGAFVVAIVLFTKCLRGKPC